MACSYNLLQPSLSNGPFFKGSIWLNNSVQDNEVIGSKVHSFLKQCLHDLCLTQKSGAFTIIQ